MLPLLVTTVAQDLTPSFWQQPIDVVLNQILLWFGWIPIALVLLWGFSQMWLNYRQGLYQKKIRWVLLAIDVPSATEQSPKAVENLFSGICGARSTLLWKDKWIVGKADPVFSLEIASDEGYIQFYIRTEERFRDLIESAIYAHYPDAQIATAEDYAGVMPVRYPNDVYDMWGVEHTLKNDYIFPIRTYVDFEDRIAGEIKDPLAQILEQMARMGPGEHLWTQILIRLEGNDWKKKGEKYINKTYGVEEKKKQGGLEQLTRSILELPSGVTEQMIGIKLNDILFGSAPEKKDEDIWRAFKITAMEKESVDSVLRKIGKVGYGVKMRTVYCARKGIYALYKRAPIVKGLFHQFTHLNLNAFSLYPPSIPRDDYFWQRWTTTKKKQILAAAFKGRSFSKGANQFYMNVEEIASLWHFPPITIKAPLIKKSEAKRGEPPVGLPITLPGAMEAGLPGMSAKGEKDFATFPRLIPAEDGQEISVVRLASSKDDQHKQGETQIPITPLKDDEIAVFSVEAPNISVPAGLRPPDLPKGNEEEKAYIPPNLPV
ncbi:TPA: hypothetical protein DEP34_01435 [Candidatus Uhrbacteria bacterium]|uniref:DUF8128 domain-containing protein n=2 Tax=Candidatus Uhriibacteriota TaxID=1752732 RepID=A0A0G1Q875_9BACT|nr:MAG: hypothetical protein UX45_C0004G0034 [Candidatus Uhrbacteria bacterium GW2011_GWF2_46_218]KKU41042.1 MAG: hypothetical protein UX57_C0007G0074 [Candidatus Uhrbacteria bacterium GW2011_GWE2_46_68]HBK33728.1 hypothetical protein [Candidatus Uhrbacteria bacterium]HCB19031.1 hypothetical protein [Candidatus Uhrbacteria bacterium]